MELNQYEKRLFIGFILISLLLHLLLLLIPKASLFPRPPRPEPVYVEVRPTPQPDLSRELDLPIRPELEKPRETPAQRLGPADQVVDQEVAPEGKDDIDQPIPQQASKPAPPAAPRPEPEPRQKPSEELTRREATEPVEETAPKETLDSRVTKEATRPPVAAAPPPKPMPDLEKLTTISPRALARIESDWRRKYRQDVERGDTVWLNTEHDLLNSFMRRFRTNIYMVWNYPAQAQQQLQQGTCLLRITINRQGDVEDVLLLESSGYPLLDREAIEAVRKGATYGPLPRAYPNEQLKIMAFFQYSLNGNIVQSRRRPGQIY